MLPGWSTPSQSAEIVGSIEKIIPAKRSHTALLFFVDGVTWKQRQSDPRKIVACQNNGDIPGSTPTRWRPSSRLTWRSSRGSRALTGAAAWADGNASGADRGEVSGEARG